MARVELDLRVKNKEVFELPYVQQFVMDVEASYLD